ncbi:MAG: hypothetical protein QM730_02350 [Anaerolineales bacterium]
MSRLSLLARGIYPRADVAREDHSVGKDLAIDFVVSRAIARPAVNRPGCIAQLR